MARETYNQSRALPLRDYRNNLRRQKSLGKPFGPSDVITSSNSLRCLPRSSSFLSMKAFFCKFLLIPPANHYSLTPGLGNSIGCLRNSELGALYSLRVFSGFMGVVM